MTPQESILGTVREIEALDRRHWQQQSSASLIEIRFEVH